jgi:predicted aspartyl protease
LPSFEVSLPDLRASGPVIQVFIGPSRELIAAIGAASVSSPLPISALVDTGAASTVITPETARNLQLRAVGMIRVHTPTTVEPVLCRQFYVNINFTSTFAIEDILAIEAPLTGQAIQCLIGRDVLSRGVLAYSGVDNLFRLTF